MWKLFKTKVIKALGGFPTLEDAIDAIQEMELEEKKVLLTLAVRRLYNTLGPDDILREEGGQWVSEGKAVPDGVKKLLISEARQFSQSRLWEYLQRDVKYQANRRMFLIGKTETDLIAGKLWLFTLDAIRTRLSSMANGTGTFNSTG